MRLWRRRRRDPFNAVPDDVLLRILCLLPLKQAIRTSVISSRWRNLWKRIPILNFEPWEWSSYSNWLGDRVNSAREYIRHVNILLRSHETHALEEFKVCFDLDYNDGPDIDDWLQFLLFRKVQRLDIDLYGFYSLIDYYYLDLNDYYEDSYILREHTIRRSCGPKGFKFLTSLSLKRVKVTGEVVTFFLQNAPFLERLVVHGSHILSSLKVCGSSLKLKHLEVCHCYHLDSLKISAPHLASLKVTKFEGLLLDYVPMLVEVAVPWYFETERDVFKKFSTKIYKIALPSLSCCLSQLEFLALRSHRPLKIKDNGMVPELPRLKKLIFVLDSWADRSLLGLTSLISASPKLEEFTLQLSWNWEGVGREVNMGTIKPCSHNCLKVVEFIGYEGPVQDYSSDFELLKYFIENCIALNRIKIYPYYPYYDPPDYADSNWFDEFDETRDAVKKQLEGQVPDHIELTVHSSSRY